MKQADHLDPTLKLPLTNVTDESNPEDSSVGYNDITNQETFVGESLTTSSIPSLLEINRIHSFQSIVLLFITIFH